MKIFLHKNPHTTLHIIIKNLFTIFNFVNIVLAAMIILVGSYKNLLFIFIAIANTLISIINELRAKKIVDKMRLLAEQNPTIIKNNRTFQVKRADLKQGDLLVLALGDQVPADSVVEEGNIEVNEAFITGEQDNIMKHPGDKLVSGSFIVSGTCKARIITIPSESFVAKLEASAHHVKTADSKLFTIINNIIKIISIALIPIGVLLLLARFRVPGTSFEVAVTSTVAALINMIPEGLVLLTSSVLALATIRLSKQHVLVQDLYAVETLARVDCICLDKTGTITTGRMTVRSIIPAKNQSKIALENALKLILAHSETDNATSAALKKHFSKSLKNAQNTPILETIPFSSERKYSGVRTQDSEYLMGALEFITKKPAYLAEANKLPKNLRVLAVIKKTGNKDILLGFALLEDELRKDAHNIIDFFVKNAVDIKIISGDNQSTVNNIALSVGFPYPVSVDLSKLSSPKNYDHLVEKYNIFTRVTPSEKKSLILAMKKQGKTVAMTGDGVNDILAMKEADCSIAIGDGSDAARRSAKIVLLDSDFSAVPNVIAEGRQSINNLERSATLFLTKTVYAAILAVIFIFAPISYPFSPISMSLLNTLCIGIPGLILALEKNTARIKDQFVKNIKRYSIPTGVAISIAALTISILGHIFAFSRPLLLTISVITVFVLDFILLCRISRPLTKLRFALLVGVFFTFVLALFVPPVAAFFEFFRFF